MMSLQRRQCQRKFRKLHTKLRQSGGVCTQRVRVRCLSGWPDVLLHDEREHDDDESSSSTRVAFGAVPRDDAGVASTTTRTAASRVQSTSSERCFVVASKRRGRNDGSCVSSMRELAALTRTLGLECVGSRAMRSLSSGSFVSSSLRDDLVVSKATTLVVDDELSPSEQARAEAELSGLHVRVADRTALILSIFEQRAAGASREGKLQVEMASLRYQLPRLKRRWTHLDRQRGSSSGDGTASRGMGESQLDVDKSLLRARIAKLRRELDGVRMHRSLYRRRRKKNKIPVCAVVGYTNVGKTTLMSNICGQLDTEGGEEVLSGEDALFATLDPTTRRFNVRGQHILMTDTVGLIRKLPTALIAAFRATLEELESADLLLHVVDCSADDMTTHARTVEEVLSALDVSTIPMLTVFNKADACPPERRRDIERMCEGRNDLCLVSARTGAGIDELRDAILRQVRDRERRLNLHEDDDNDEGVENENTEED